ncbi:hypothetical protein H5410_026105 [Solanum commersonii]|uniref:Uncharacterized protein n=1 Tax=Solanum commersonii TaxID=4109 RepID=A0A9J5YXR4_SOLCO|nr:hypothetical protein H5410_026105 [Solanum commersonii]
MTKYRGMSSRGAWRLEDDIVLIDETGRVNHEVGGVETSLESKGFMLSRPKVIFEVQIGDVLDEADVEVRLATASFLRKKVLSILVSESKGSGDIASRSDVTYHMGR